jgi:hypothetical protein
MKRNAETGRKRRKTGRKRGRAEIGVSDGALTSVGVDGTAEPQRSPRDAKEEE